MGRDDRDLSEEDATLARHAELAEVFEGKRLLKWSDLETFIYDSGCLTPQGKQVALSQGLSEGIGQFQWIGTEAHVLDFRFLKLSLDEQAEKQYTLSTNKRNRTVRRTREMGGYRSQSIYHLHIQLEEIEPAIWRRISVPGKISLARLHRLLQLAMGWENYHLHLFTIGAVCYGEPDPEYADDGFQIKHDRYASVRDVLRTEGMRFRYDYDFGDNWRHDVLVERIEVLDAEDWVAPRCLDGRRACPPEDCGGVSGYDELIEALRDPHHEDHERLRTWVGVHYDPELFSVQQLNSAFAVE